MSLFKLPNELLQKITDYLPDKDLNVLTRTNHQLYNRLIDHLYARDLKAGSWALIWAVQECIPATAQRMLQLGADANAPFLSLGQARPLLIIAVSTGQIQLARLLLENGADPNGRDGVGETAIFPAARNGDVHAVGLLLEFGADWDVYDFDEIEPRTPLDHALEGGSLYVVDLLLDAGSRVVKVEVEVDVEVEVEVEVESEIELDLRSELELEEGEPEAITLSK